ncbi:MAG: hypothetical protein M1825_006100 [Sarcosagium campestre]|nr:MAG: hypothetical protein M1825_006100 [Sarcosagium campestre]
MYYDLNIPWAADDAQLPSTLAFLDELGYNVIALNHTLSGKLPSDLSNPIPSPLHAATPSNLRILRRCTLVFSDLSQNHRLSTLSSNYDFLAIRPTNEKCLQQACQSVECALISLDLTVRHPYYFKHSLLRSAINRGVRFELCYAPGITTIDPVARRNLISNATQLIRATRGRGIVVSSEAASAVGVRAPVDVVNLATVWGLGSERAREALDKEPRTVVVTAKIQRTSWRGVVDVVVAPERGVKRKAATVVEGEEGGDDSTIKPVLPPVSKRQAKKARLEELKKARDNGTGKKSIELGTTTIGGAAMVHNNNGNG